MWVSCYHVLAVTLRHSRIIADMSGIMDDCYHAGILLSHVGSYIAAWSGNSGYVRYHGMTRLILRKYAYGCLAWTHGVFSKAFHRWLVIASDGIVGLTGYHGGLSEQPIMDLIDR